MANTTITNLPASVSLTGAEQLEAVQSGSSVRVTASQIAALAQNTQGTVTQIDTAGALTGGPITTTGTISLPPDAVTNVYLAEMPANTVKANLTGLTANPTDVTPSAVLNTFGSSAGSMLYRGASLWEALSPGTTGQYLSTTGATPQWVTLSVSPGQLTPTGVVPGTYGTASSVPTITVNAGGQLTAASNTLISIPAGQVTGLGTMAIQNANAVAITGGNIDGTAIGSTSASSAAFTTISAGTWNGSPIGIAYGGTGATTAPTARTNLGLGTMATQNASAVAITGGTIDGVSIGGSNPQGGSFTTLNVSGNAAMSTITSGTWNGNAIGVAYGGTGATDATTARTNLSAAKSGANSDITSLSGLTTPLSAPQGGTGFSSYTEGDLLYAPTSSSLGRLNDVAVGNVLLSGGVGVAPAYGKVGLTTHVDGVLPVANGGTGAATLTGYVKGNGTSAMTASATIPNSDLQNSTIQIGSTSIALGASSSTLAGLTSVTLTQDPTAALQASTKQYVDDQVATVSNLTYHTQVVASTTANLNATYNNGSSGVGATLTNAGAFAVFSIDSTSPTATQRVLIKDQTNAAQNGIYVVTTVGDAISVPWVLTRASDFNAQGSGPNFIQTGASVFVQGGTTWGSTSWVMVTTGTINVGSTNLVWTQTSSSGNILVNAPLAKAGNTISLNTVTVPFGGTGQTSYTIGDLLYADSSSSLAKLADVATGNVLRSGGIGVAPAWGKVDLTTDVTGTLPVGNGGTGTATAFTQGSVLFAGASGVYSQNNANFYWDNVNTRLGIHTASPDATLTVLSETQTALPPGALPAGTDLHIVGANNADARITQDAFGTGNYPAYTGRHARGTAASPTATQSGDILSQYTGRGYGATGYNSSSTGVFLFEAAENFTDTAQGTFASLKLTATGAASPTEVFRIGPSGQVGVGGSSYGTSNQLLTSGGSGAAPSWQSGINVTTIGASGAVTLSTTTDTIAIGTSQTSGLLNIGGASQTGAISIAPSTKTITIGLGAGATESAETKTLNLGTAGVSGSTTAINIGASASGSISTTTLYGTVKVNGLTASKGVFTDASSNFTSTGTLATDQGGTGLTTFSVGDIPYYASGTALSKLSIGSNGQVLTSNGTAPVWTNASSISVSTATNLAGGAAGSIPYQSGASTTTFLSIGTADRVMTSTGTAPQWVTSLTGLTGVSSSGLTNTNLTSGRVVYSTTGGAQTDSANLTFDGTTLTANSATVSTGNLAVTAGNLTFGGTAQRITGDFSNATIASRLMFQTSTANSNTAVENIPSGTGTTTRWTAYNNSDPTNASFLQFGITGTTEAVINSGVRGTGTYVPITFQTSGSERMRLDTSGNLGIGTASPVTTFGKNLTLYNDANTGTVASNTYLLVQSLNRNGVIDIASSATGTGSLNFVTTPGTTLAGIAGDIANSALAFRTGGTTERMRIDSSGNVGIGTASPLAWLQVGAGTNAVAMTGTQLLSVKTSGASAGVSAKRDGFAEVGMQSGGGGGYVGTWTNDVLNIVTNGTSNVRMVVDTSGNVGIGGTANAFSKLNITGTLASSGANSLPMYIDGTIPSTTTSQAQIFRSNVTTQATSFTLNTLAHFMAGAGSGFGAGSTVTTHVGFWANSDMIGGTNNFGFRSSIASGANRWNVYSDGTADNYFAGNVGIGTASPSNKLQVSLDANSGSGITVSNANTGTSAASQITFGTNIDASMGYIGVKNGAGTDANQLIIANRVAHGIYFRTNDTNRMYIDSSGKVGIGTASPQRVLSVVSSSADSQVTVGNTAPSMSLTNDASNPNGASKTFVMALATAAGNYGLNDGEFLLGGVGNSRGNIVINANYSGTGTKDVILQPSTGNVGINVVPVAKLDVLAAANQRFMVRERSSGAVCLDSVVANNTAYQTMVLNGSTVAIQTAATNRVTIDGSGNVAMTAGLGVNGASATDATFKFQVQAGRTALSANSEPYALGLRYNSTTGHCYVGATNSGTPDMVFSNSAGSEICRMFNAGGFSVGTTTGPGAGAIYATGNITAYFSDARLKDFKGKIDGALNKISQLNGYYYIENAKAEEYGYNNKATQVGVSAQEVKAVLPEVVSAAPFDLDENGESKSGENYMTVNYEKLVPLLIEAIKELKAEVEALKAVK